MKFVKVLEEMIKRRFFKHEHGDKDVPSDSSSSSSDDSESEVELDSDNEEIEHDDDNVVAEQKHSNVPSSSSSGLCFSPLLFQFFENVSVCLCPIVVIYCFR